MPILIHGGRGLPPIASDLARLVLTYPEAQLIIAHAGIADLGRLMHAFAGKAGVFFDTSAWSPIASGADDCVVAVTVLPPLRTDLPARMGRQLSRGVGAA